jgi:hypothetical protein
MIASNPSWNLMLVLPLAVRTVMLIVRPFRLGPADTGTGPLLFLPCRFHSQFIWKYMNLNVLVIH